MPGTEHRVLRCSTFQDKSGNSRKSVHNTPAFSYPHRYRTRIGYIYIFLAHYIFPTNIVNQLPSLCFWQHHRIKVFSVFSPKPPIRLFTWGSEVRGTYPVLGYTHFGGCSTSAVGSTPSRLTVASTALACSPFRSCIKSHI